MNAMNTFIDHIRESQAMLETIEGFLGDHMRKNPETLNWGDTGDAARLREMLTDIMTAFNLDDKGA